MSGHCSADKDNSSFIANIQLFLDSLPMPAALIDIHGQIIACNSKLLRQFKYKKKDILGSTTNQLFSQLHTHPQFPHLTDYEGSYTFEARFQKKDGSKFIGEASIGKYNTEMLNGYVMLITDITSLRVAETDVQKDKEKYQLLVENQTDLIVKIDMNFRLQFISPSYCETFGISEKEWLGATFFPMIHEDDKEIVKKSLNMVTKPPYHTNHQERAYTANGLRWFSWSARAVFNENGKIDSIVSVGRDITEQKKAEINLKKSEKRYHTLFEEAIDGIAIADAKTGKLVDCNKALCNMVNRTKEELIGKAQSILHPAKNQNGQLTKTFKRHVHTDEGKELATQIITKGGQIKEVLIKGSHMVTEEGHFIQGVFHDMTEYYKALQKIENLAKFPEENPSPVLRVSTQGIINYANNAAKYLLNWLDTDVGSHLPHYYLQIVTSALREQRTIEAELPIENTVILMLFVPVAEHGYINMYGIDITKRKQNEEKLNELATTDDLTGLINRRRFLELSQHEKKRSNRYGSPLSLLMLDIDHFKNINDTYGHPAGDTVLIELKNTSLRMLRGIDIIARVGGEEFAVLLPETDLKNAEKVADRFRKAVEILEIPYNGETIQLTISIGITDMKNKDDTISVMWERSDKALYKAKNSGRNRVKIYNET